MMRLPNACLILENVTCSGCFSQNRLFLSEKYLSVLARDLAQARRG